MNRRRKRPKYVDPPERASLAVCSRLLYGLSVLGSVVGSVGTVVGRGVVEVLRDHTANDHYFKF